MISINNKIKHKIMGTKKVATLVFLAVVFGMNAFSQNIGIGMNADGSAPAGSAILDISSGNKGFLPPRMTYVQRMAIASPIAGLMVYCTNCGTVGELQVFNGIAWTNVTGNVASVPKPDAPTIGTATAGTAKATVAFTAPASDGGFTITSYTATSSPGGITGTLSRAGSGTITVTGLTAGTAYTFTVTATTVSGTGPASGASNSVTPTAPELITDGSGNTYEILTVGWQTWMAKNLYTTKYSDGTDIPKVISSSSWSRLTSEAYCDYNNDALNAAIYGRLYNWYAVKTGKLCPTGWHVPSNNEWLTLTTVLGGESVAGGRLKETGTAHWTAPNSGATDEKSFTALPGGYRSRSGPFSNIGNIGYWWSSTEYMFPYANYRFMSYDNTVARRTYDSEGNGMSVRCLKD
jgi:uncharacterized protein (TIGR02145 family)